MKITKKHSLIMSVAILVSLRAAIIGAQGMPTTMVSPLYEKISVTNVSESMTVNGQSLSGNSMEKTTVELVNGKPLITKIVTDIHM